MLSQSELKRRISYDAATGLFVRIRSARGDFVGKPAGTIDAWGYLVIKIRDKSYKAHRLAWLYVYGEWPAEEIDHINQVKTDNRILNLRSVPRLLNARNLPLKKTNKSGVAGVQKLRQYWMATGRGPEKLCKAFVDWFDAVCARKSWEDRNGIGGPNASSIG